MLRTMSSQRGVALLTILLLVVSITIVAGAMLASQKVAIRRSGLLFDQNQLLQDIDAGTQLALAMIRAESEINDTDSMQDIWAKPIPPYPLGSDSVTFELRDEASRFNINNLYHDGATDEAAFAVLQRLLTQFDVDPDVASAILDWQDPDLGVYQDGGDEGMVYSQSRSSVDHTLPNQPFSSVDQLQDVQGMDPEALARLTPYLSAVPYFVPINVNTASPTLLAALTEDVTSTQMQALISVREKQVLSAVDDLWQQPALRGLSEEQREMVTPLLAVDSRAFMTLISVTNTDGKQRFATVLISKMDAETTVNNQSRNEDANTNTSDSVNSDAAAAKDIKVVTQRLWAFRPSFTSSSD